MSTLFDASTLKEIRLANILPLHVGSSIGYDDFLLFSEKKTLCDTHKAAPNIRGCFLFSSVRISSVSLVSNEVAHGRLYVTTAC